MNELQKSLAKYFRNKTVVVAFSGGVDSTVLLEVALDNAREVLPVTVKSSLVPSSEIDFAIEYLNRRNVRYKVVQVNPLDHPSVEENSERRCYFCKKLVFETIIQETKIFNPELIVEGSNTSDLNDYRPGMEAVKELAINSPYLELGISKEQIKNLARHMMLDIAEKPSTTCLATRIPYGISLSEERLERIEAAEVIIKEILSIEVLRVRDHGEVARVEVLEEDIKLFLKDDKRNLIRQKLREIGYSYVTVDLGGYKMGSMNINIPGVEIE